MAGRELETGMTLQAPAPSPNAAARSSFYAGMRILPRPEREAMFAVYGFCRQVDDIADDVEGKRPDRRRDLDAWRRDLDALYAGRDPGRAIALEGPVGRYGLRQPDFLAVIDGMQMDVDEDIRGPELTKLDLYCDRVASAVGRLSVRIFGMDEAPGLTLAHHLGRALQLTNILRDIDEDAGMGRLYLPRELLEAAGLAGLAPDAAIADPRVDGVCRELAGLARRHYGEAELVMASRPAGRMATPRLMGAVYSRILDRTERQGWAPPRRRQRLGKGELAWLVLRRGLLG